MLDSIGKAVITVVQVAHEAIDRALRDAYERGLADGREQAKKEFMERLEGVFKEPAPKPTVTLEASVPHKAVGRAPKGSVEPAVITALEKSDRGMKTSEVAGHANVPENSARSMLNKLRIKGRVTKRGDFWFLVRHELAKESSNNESSASSNE